MVICSARIDQMLSNWFRSKDVDEFADSIIADLQSRFPPAGTSREVKNAGKRLLKTHRVILARIEAFARATDLSVYRKARLGNRVKWALAEAGYPKPFVDAFVHELVTLLALVPRDHKKRGGHLTRIGS